MASGTPCATNLPTYDEYDERRKTYRKQLLRSVDPTEVLLSALSDIEPFQEKIPEIRLLTDEDAAIKILLLPLENNFANTIGPFLSALHTHGHAHVANVFITGSDSDLMTDNDYQKLCDKLSELCTYLDPDCEVISRLVSKGVFTLSDGDRIRIQGTVNNKVNKIIQILSHKPNGSYQHFLDILLEERIDQQHVVQILTDRPDLSPPISKEDLILIGKQREAILRNMESIYSYFVSTLVSFGVLTDKDRQRVEEMKVTFRRNEKILNILTRKSRGHLEKFIEALKHKIDGVDQKHVADLFNGLTIDGTVHITLPKNSSTEKQGHAEEVTRATMASDLDDKESETRRKLDRFGMHGSGVDTGSIRIWFKFFSKESLEVMRSNKLDMLFTDVYCALLSDLDLRSIHVEIPENKLKRCEQSINERKPLMTPEHQYALELAKEKIADKINVDEELLRSLPLCTYRKDAILSQSKSKDKARVLLEVMARRPDCDFRQLLNALRRTGQDIATKFIKSAGKNI